MRILRVVSSGWAEGGVESGIIAMQPLFAARGHEVRVLASNSHPNEKHFSDYEFQSLENSKWGTMSRIHNVSAARMVRQICREYQPDVIQVHTMGQTSPSVLTAQRKVPTVVTAHGPELYIPHLLKYCLPSRAFVDSNHENRVTPVYGRIRLAHLKYALSPVYLASVKRADGVVALSKYMQSILKASRVNASYVPNGVEIFDSAPVRDAGSPPVLLYVGRLEPYKGVGDAIEALRMLASTFPTLTLRIAGEGTSRQALEKQALHLVETRRVTFLGRVSRQGLERELADSTALVLPSTWPEAFGKVGVEAMSVGRPVIGTHVGGTGDWLRDGYNGLVVEPGSPTAIRDAAMRLLTDRHLLESLSLNSRETAVGFSLDSHVDAMLAVYRSVIGEE